MIVAEENKKRTAVWLTPGVIRRMDGWLEEDNCKTRSEFIEKALRFYMGYLAAEDTSEYLSRALVDTLRGTLADKDVYKRQYWNRSWASPLRKATIGGWNWRCPPPTGQWGLSLVRISLSSLSLIHIFTSCGPSTQTCKA